MQVTSEKWHLASDVTGRNADSADIGKQSDAMVSGRMQVKLPVQEIGQIVGLP